MKSIFHIHYALFLVLTCLGLLLPNTHHGQCTAFCCQAEDTIIFGKNLDWPVGEGLMMVNRRGEQKKSLPQAGKESLRWIADYGSVTFNMFGKEFPLGGMNEAGLVVEELSYSPSKYPADSLLYSINEFQWIQYQLDKHQSVEEVLNNLQWLQINPLLVKVHYMVADSSGHMAVIEFLDGKIHVFTGDDLPVPVLSNNKYQNTLRYLRMHKGFGGDLEIRKGAGSQERFVRAAEGIKNYRPDPGKSLGRFASGLLEDLSQDDTQWSIIYNLSCGQITYKTRFHNEAISVDFNQLDFGPSRQSWMMIMMSPQVNLEMKPGHYYEWDAYINKLLLKRVLGQMVTLGEIDEEKARIIKEKILALF